MTSAVASAPGKVMMAGEYGVVDGGPSVLIAVARRATATFAREPQALSPFLQAARDALATAGFARAAAAMERVVVDSASFREGKQKLGLGSSAAVTVAAMALCLHVEAAFDVERVYQLALEAHGNAQEAMGARGSGADIACSSYGGAVYLPKGKAQSPRRAHTLTVRGPVHLVLPWTGRSASTPELVARVRAWADANPERYGGLCQRIGKAADEVKEALTSQDPGTSLVPALEEAGAATRALSEASGAGIWLPVHDELTSLAKRHRGSLKPTGAGGGDLALAAFGCLEDAESFKAELGDHGILCPDLALEIEGVRLGS